MITPEIIREVLLSAALFIVVWQVLGRLVYKPFFAVLEEREAKTAGADTAAQEKRGELKQAQKRVEELVMQARLQGIAARDEIVKKAQTEGQELIALATAKAEAEIQQGKDDLAVMRQRLYAEFDRESEKVAELVLNRVVSTSEVLH